MGNPIIDFCIYLASEAFKQNPLCGTESLMSTVIIKAVINPGRSAYNIPTKSCSYKNTKNARTQNSYFYLLFLTLDHTYMPIVSNGIVFLHLGFFWFQMNQNKRNLSIFNGPKWMKKRSWGRGFFPKKFLEKWNWKMAFWRLVDFLGR